MQWPGLNQVFEPFSLYIFCEDLVMEIFLYTGISSIFMPPTLKKLEGHIAFGLSVCVCVCTSVNF